MKFIYKLFCSILIFTSLYSGFKLLHIAKKYQDGKKCYAEIKSEASTLYAQKLSETDAFTKSMKKSNPDYIAWITIDNTKIDYPIVVDSSQTNYLTHDFNGNQSCYGCIFISHEQPFTKGNTVIYGHNMKNGDMFGSLKKYLNPPYYKDHKYISVFFNGQLIKYHVFSVQIVDVNSNAYNFNISTDYIEEMNKASLVRAPAPTTTAAIITLSTCYHSTKRLLIQAYKERDKI